MEAAWKLTIPIDRKGGVLNFELKEIGIDEFLAVQKFLLAQKQREGFILFLNSTRIGGDEVEKLKAEFDKNNIIPFMSCIDQIPKIMEPVPGELKKN